MAFGAGACLALLALGGAPAAAGPVPDAVRLERLQADAGPWPRIRVLSTRARHDVTTFRADSLGVIWRPAPGRAAVVVGSGLAPEEPRRIPWAEIESIDGSRSRRGGAVLHGVIVGAIVGASASVLVLAESESLAALSLFPLGIAAGGIAGGALRGPEWTRLYP